MTGGAGTPGGSKQPLEPRTGPQTLILEDFPSTEDARALSPNGRAHWAVRLDVKNRVAVRVKVEADRYGLRTMHGPVRLLFRYVFPDHRKRDVDNLTTGVTKAIIDALVRGEWLVADDSEHVISVRAVPVVEKGSRRLEIVLEHVEV